MNDTRINPRLLALIVTLAVMIAMVATLVKSYLSVRQPDDHEWPPRSHSEIIFEPVEEKMEYVPTFSDAADNAMETGDTDSYAPSDVTSDQPTQTSHHRVDAGHAAGQSTPPQTQRSESPAKVKPTEKPTGNRNPNPEDQAAAEARRQQQATRNIEDRMQNRFSGAGKGEGKAAVNDADGKASAEGKGAGRGVGMTPSVNQRPPSDKLGTIVVTCTVAPDGTVVKGSARVASVGNSGEAANDAALRQKCVEAAYKCRFARSTADDDNRPGTITFRWEDRK